MSQTQLARQLGMQQSAIARLEAGDHEPSLATLQRLSKGLGIDFHISIISDGRIELDSPQQERAERENVLQLLRQYAEANSRARQDTWVVIDQALASHPSFFLRVLEGRPAFQTWLSLVLRTSRAREEDELIREELEQFLRDEAVTGEASERARWLA